MPVTRSVNPRGRGADLRDEIMQAATRLLASASARNGVTLRAIAREAGVAAPSIYPHFVDRDAILDAVVARTFEQLRDVSAAAADAADTGAARIRAICAAYLTFARERPGQYRILFERAPANVSGRQYPAGIAAFGYLASAVEEAVAEGSSASTDPTRDAQALWVALHGLVTLVPATPAFPWRPTDALVERVIVALAALQPAPPAPKRTRKGQSGRRSAGRAAAGTRPR